MKKIFTIAAFLLSLQLTFAQTVSYKILEDNPEKRNYVIAANVIDFNAYSANISVGVNVYGNALIGKKFQADIDIRKAWTDMGEGVFAPKDLTKAYHIMVGGRYNLFNKISKKNTRVVLSSYSYRSGDKNITSSYSIQVPATVNTILSVRGGLQFFYNNADNSENDQIKGKLNGKVDILSQVGTGSFESINYSIGTLCLYGGISYKSIIGLLIKPEGYGEKRKSGFDDFYADLLFAPLVSYNINPNDGQKPNYKNVDMNISENSKKYLGWRAGWQKVIGNKVLGTIKMEIGQQPGNYNGSFFANIGLGIGFGGKLKIFDK